MKYSVFVLVDVVVHVVGVVVLVSVAEWTGRESSVVEWSVV